MAQGYSTGNGKFQTRRPTREPTTFIGASVVGSKALRGPIEHGGADRAVAASALDHDGWHYPSLPTQMTKSRGARAACENSLLWWFAWHDRCRNRRLAFRSNSAAVSRAYGLCDRLRS